MGIGKMADKEVKSLSKAEHDELCCSYAALMLHDDGVEITGEKLAKVIKSSGNEVDAYWPTLFAQALAKANVDDLLTNVASAGSGGGPAAAGPAAAAAAEAAPEEKPEEKEEEAVDMGGLFDEEEY